MHARRNPWLSVQVTAASLDTTSAEVCRLLSIGRLSGTKLKQPGRPGKAQWLVNPNSVTQEKRLRARRAASARRK